ncbi:HTH domain-containing protein [Tenuifilum thalassicum]|uniref:Helix-turn-helix domain-containing protein n=1 Tax=Tenuifilum thalassicum TaxID=2590900 RepID=A0A7D4BS42_9BACT|nr:helix-turn-helix domain-containing protein [Tenuifilum thalassicum]
MNIIESKRLIEYLDFLLRRGNAGTAPEIADKLGVSERTVRSYFEQLENIKVPVEYNPTYRTWKFSRPGRLVLCFIEDESNTQNTDTPNFHPPHKYAIKHKIIYRSEVWLPTCRFTLY